MRDHLPVPGARFAALLLLLGAAAACGDNGTGLKPVNLDASTVQTQTQQVQTVTSDPAIASLLSYASAFPVTSLAGPQAAPRGAWRGAWRGARAMARLRALAPGARGAEGAARAAAPRSRVPSGYLGRTFIHTSSGWVEDPSRGGVPANAVRIVLYGAGGGEVGFVEIADSTAGGPELLVTRIYSGAASPSQVGRVRAAESYMQGPSVSWDSLWTTGVLGTEGKTLFMGDTTGVNLLSSGAYSYGWSAATRADFASTAEHTTGAASGTYPNLSLDSMRVAVQAAGQPVRFEVGWNGASTDTMRVYVNDQLTALLTQQGDVLAANGSAASQQLSAFVDAVEGLEAELLGADQVEYAIEELLGQLP